MNQAAHPGAPAEAWDGWELWYFGSDYLSRCDTPPDHWRLAPHRPEPVLRVVSREPSPPCGRPAPLPVHAHAA